MSSFYLASDKTTEPTGPDKHLKECLNRVSQLHAEAARSRSEIIALRNSTLAELEECAAVVRARSDKLLAQLDEIEIRRKVDIETAIVAAEDIAESVGDPAMLHVIKSTQYFYAIKSIDMPDWRAIREHSLQLFEFREFPVLDITDIRVYKESIEIPLPDTVRTWGDANARQAFLGNRIEVVLMTQDGKYLPTKYMYGICWDSTIECFYLNRIQQLATSYKNVLAVVYVDGKPIHKQAIYISVKRLNI